MIGDLWLLYRERIVAAALLAALNAGLLVAVVRPAREAAAARRTGEARVAADARARDAAVAAHAALAETGRQADAFLATFPARTALLPVTTRIQGAARRLGLAVPAMDYRPEMRAAAGQPLDRTVIAVRVEGPYGAVRRLLHEVEQERSSLVVDAVALRGGRARGAVQMALDLSAYARLTVPIVAPPASAAAPAEVPPFLATLVDRARPAYPPERRNLFATRSSVAVPRLRPAPPSAPPAIAAATPAPLPVATVPSPPAPDLRLLGTSGGAAGLRAFVSAAGEVLVLRRGDRVGAGYVVKEIAPERLVLRSADGTREMTLSLGEGARHAP